MSLSDNSLSDLWIEFKQDGSYASGTGTNADDYGEWVLSGTKLTIRENDLPL